MPFCKMILFVCGLIVSRAKLSLELLALRQQLVVLRRTVQRPQIQNRDRWFWIVVSRIWKDRQQALIVVKPETVIKWHRQGFKMYWRWKSRSSQVGRPKLDKEIRDLIRRMSDENPLWGVPRIQSDLGLLGYEVAESTVAIRRLFVGRGKQECFETCWMKFSIGTARFTAPQESIWLDFSRRGCAIRGSPSATKWPARSAVGSRDHRHGLHPVSRGGSWPVATYLAIAALISLVAVYWCFRHQLLVDLM
jgi:hypothetical protein